MYLVEHLRLLPFLTVVQKEICLKSRPDALPPIVLHIDAMLLSEFAKQQHHKPAVSLWR